VVKSVVAQFIQDRPNVGIALVAFSAEPYLMSPLTARSRLAAAKPRPGCSGHDQGRHAIGSALSAASIDLRGQKAKSKLVVLLTRWTEQRGEDRSGPGGAGRAGARRSRSTPSGSAPKGEAPMPNHRRQRSYAHRDDQGGRGLKVAQDHRGHHGWALLSRHRRRIAAADLWRDRTAWRRPRGT